jgi:hypothetical protein
MKKGHIFWGVLLLTLGILFILRNLNIFYFNIHSLLRLWPLIFVFWGISMLPVKQGVKLFLVGLSILLGILILAKNPTHRSHWTIWDSDAGYEYNKPYENDEENSSDQQNFSESYDSIVTNARLNLNAAAGKFYIKNPTDNLFELDTDGESGPYEVKTIHGDSSATINVKHKENYHSRDLSNTVWLSLNPVPVWDLNIDIGAAGIEIDVSPFLVERIDIEGGASKINLKLGSKSKLTHVNVNAGASSINIEIPYESACELRTNTVLSSRDIDGFNKISGGLYQTPNFSDSVSQIIIEIDAAVSSLEVKRNQSDL